jgi:hypothetical protein
LCSVGTSATDWPIVPVPGDYEDKEFGGMMIGRKNRSTRRRTAPVPPFPSQISHDLTGHQPGHPPYLHFSMTFQTRRKIKTTCISFPFLANTVYEQTHRFLCGLQQHCSQNTASTNFKKETLLGQFRYENHSEAMNRFKNTRGLNMAAVKHTTVQVSRLPL